jgi:hypothetical protein
MPKAFEMSPVSGEAAPQEPHPFALLKQARGLSPSSPRRPHPRPDLLLRFLRGEATRAENRAVVRHLLTGCRECVAITRPVWKLADEALLPQPQLRREERGG